MSYFRVYPVPIIDTQPQEHSMFSHSHTDPDSLVFAASLLFWGILLGLSFA